MVYHCNVIHRSIDCFFRERDWTCIVPLKMSHHCLRREGKKNSFFLHAALHCCFYKLLLKYVHMMLLISAPESTFVSGRANVELSQNKLQCVFSVTVWIINPVS